MSFSKITYTYSGQSTYAVNFTLGYLSQDHVTCRVNDEVDGSQQPVYRTITWITEGTVSISGSLTTGDTIVFERTTPKDEAQHDYQNGSLLIEKNLDESFLQAIMIAHEALDGRLSELQNELDAGNNKIINLADPTDAQDAATKNYIDTFEAINTAAIIAARDKAEQWANEDEDVEVETGKYSAKHWSEKTAQDAIDTAADVVSTNADVAATAANLAAAQQLLDEAPFSETTVITNAQSPFTVDDSVKGHFLSVDTSGGDVVLDVSATLTEPFTIRIKKNTSDANTITINLNGTEEFRDGDTSKVIESVGGMDLTLDTDSSPDTWDFAKFGATAGEPKAQTFNAGSDYTKGTTTLTITSTPVPPSSTALEPYYDGIRQHNDQWSYDPATGVFTDSAGIQADSVQFKWEATSIAIAVTGDGTVTYEKTASSFRSNEEDAQNGTANESFMTPLRVKQAIDANALDVQQSNESLSGGDIDFTIPAGVKQIEMYLTDVSFTGSGGYLSLQLGDADGIEATGYVGNYSDDAGTSTQMSSHFYISDYASAANVNQAKVVLTLIDAATNKWYIDSQFARTDSTHTGEATGHKSLSAELTTLRLTSSLGGVDFDAGEVYLRYLT